MPFIQAVKWVVMGFKAGWPSGMGGLKWDLWSLEWAVGVWNGIFICLEWDFYFLFAALNRIFYFLFGVWNGIFILFLESGMGFFSSIFKNGESIFLFFF